MSERIRIIIDRKRDDGWYRIAIYDFSTPESISDIIKYLNSHSDRPILDKYVRFLEGLKQ
ncbi:hypothetical protein ES703_06909 [subsurface metagenome]